MILFSHDDFVLFSLASGDTNPLHMSPEYASRTSFGQPVVFGALGTMACLGSLEPEEQERITVLDATFHRPLFAGVRYTLQRSDKESRVLLRLMDGSVQTLSVSVSLQENGFDPAAVASIDSGEANFSSENFPRREAAQATWADWNPGQTWNGQYRASNKSLNTLALRWGAQSCSADLLQALCWSSYFVGMESPGESALFFRLNLERQTPPPHSAQALNFEVALTRKSESLGQLQYRASLSQTSDLLFKAQLTAFSRPAIASGRLSQLQYQPDSAWHDKVAVVLGASRGFGASLAINLAQRGARVVACSRSRPDWLTQLPSELADRIIAEQLDASNVDQLSALQTRLESGFGSVEFLFCSAFPPIPSLRIESNAVERIHDYLSSATKLVLAPLAAFLPMLEKNAGCAVLISSTAVTEPVRDWPHYVASKSAAESLLATAALQFPSVQTLIFRPSRMLTEMTNTPMGRSGATDPNLVANNLLDQLGSRHNLPVHGLIPASDAQAAPEPTGVTQHS